jgi:hypothetical protein
VPPVRALDHPAVSLLPKLLGERGHSTIGDVRDVTSPLRGEPNIVVVITFIGAQMLFDDARRGPRDDHRIQRCSELGLIVVVGSREDYPKRDSLTVDDEVAFCAELTTVGRVFARFIPPFTGAETVTLSSDCHFQSMPLRWSYSSRHSLQSLEKIPALVHFWKCSWAAEPEPYSRGSIFHWHPVLNTYKMPLKMVRWDVGGRPPLGERGSSATRGWTLAQNSSDTSRQPGLRGNGFRGLGLRVMVGASNKVARFVQLQYNKSGSRSI